MTDNEILQEMIACVKREVSLRCKVYPRFIAAGKITQEQAEYQQKMMQRVQRFLEEVQNGKNPQNIQLRLL